MSDKKHQSQRHYKLFIDHKKKYIVYAGQILGIYPTSQLL